MKRIVRLSAISSLILSTVLCSAMAAKKPTGWVPVRTGKLFGISGMVLIEKTAKQATFLIAHDNKRNGQGRFAIVEVRRGGSLKFTPIDWAKGKPYPYDLEALTSIPGRSGEYLANESSGKVRHLQIDTKKKKIELLGEFTLPTAGSGHNYEGLTLQKMDGKLIAAWGHRGSGKKPGTLFWAELNMDGYKMSNHESVDILIPWPTGPVRHISDLVILKSGELYGSAASDPGDNGPFSCAIYKLGTISVGKESISFKPLAAPKEIHRNDAHKAEAIILMDEEHFAAGSDDETMGSAVFVSWL